MRKLSHPRPLRYRHQGWQQKATFHDLPLFAWMAARDAPPLTTAGRHVHRRHHVPRELANLVAELAGIGRERDR